MSQKTYAGSSVEAVLPSRGRPDCREQAFDKIWLAADTCFECNHLLGCVTKKTAPDYGCWKPSDPNASDGSEKPAGIITCPVNTKGAGKKFYSIMVQGSVNIHDLTAHEDHWQSPGVLTVEAAKCLREVGLYAGDTMFGGQCGGPK